VIAVEAGAVGGGREEFALLQQREGPAGGLEDGGVGLPPPHLLLEARDRLLQGLEVGEDELGGDGLDVVLRIHPALDVHHVRVREGPGHHADGVRLADVREELVAEPLPLRGAPDNARDVHEGHGGGDDPLGVEHVGQYGEASVRQRHDPDVRLDGREGVVRREHGRPGQGVEQGRLADVGQSRDSDGEGHGEPV